ncbi:MAG: hypothetical protein M1274_12680 [Actinobacteria bacterium]|nr:hypothetical protein [Actinomycetota bacterium]
MINMHESGALFIEMEDGTWELQSLDSGEVIGLAKNREEVLDCTLALMDAEDGPGQVTLQRFRPAAAE